jgi:PKHD-type hydroxylase
METSNSLNHYSGVFTDQELDKIVELGDSMELMEGEVGYKNKGNVVDHKKRITLIAWIHHTPEVNWLYVKVAKLFSIHPVSMLQSMQYSVYHPQGHYKWHRDIGSEDNIASQRVVAATLQLSNPEDYMGGILEIDHPGNGNKIEVEKERGLISVFPAGWRHRVIPVTKGIRKTLIMWGLK